MSAAVKSYSFRLRISNFPSTHWKQLRYMGNKSNLHYWDSSSDIHIPPILSLQLLQFGDRVGCDCDALNSTLITSTADSEVAVLAPAGAPAVLDNPVLLSGHVAATIPHQEHSMVGQLKGIEGDCETCVVIDALLIVDEVRVDLWKEWDNLLFNFLLTLNSSYTVPMKQKGLQSCKG